MMQIKGGAIFATTIIGLLGVAVGFAWLALSGWPNQHLSEPAFVTTIGSDNWSDFRTQRNANAALTSALRKQIRPDATTAELVKYLDRQGFRIGTPWQDRCSFTALAWIRGCANSSGDLKRLSKARSGEVFYSWGGGACTNTIYVSWDQDAHGRAHKIEADYEETCL